MATKIQKSPRSPTTLDRGSIRRYGTVFFKPVETPQAEKIRDFLNRRNSVTLDGSVLPVVQQTLDSLYELHDLLGEGVSSQVYLGKNRKTGEYVAVKLIPKKVLIDNMELANEISILKKISHRNVIGLKDVFITQTHLQIIMDYAEGQELFEEICERRIFTEKDVKEIVIQILDAMGYLHTMGIAHRDLKPENIMIIQNGEEKRLKIIDFGFARNCDENNPIITSAGTLGYKAPEIFKGLPYTTKADMWSIGVIVYILLAGFPPFFSYEEYKDEGMLMNAPFWSFFNDETEELLDSIKNGKIDFPELFWKDITADAKDFVQSLLKVNATERMSALDALKHHWIRGKKEEVSQSPIIEVTHSPRIEVTHSPRLSPRIEVSQPDSKPVDKPIEVVAPQPVNEPSTIKQEIPPVKQEVTSVKRELKLDLSSVNSAKSGVRALPSSRLLAKTFEMHKHVRQTTLTKLIQAKPIDEIPEILEEKFVKSGVAALDKAVELKAEPEPVDEENDSDVEVSSEEEYTKTVPAISIGKVESPPKYSTIGTNDGRKVAELRKAFTEVEKTHEPQRSVRIIDVKKGQVPEGAHQWCNMTKPTWCSLCDEFIWGITKRPGLKCRRCKVVVHPECKPKIGRCGAASPRANLNRPKSVKEMAQVADKNKIIITGGENKLSTSSKGKKDSPTTPKSNVVLKSPKNEPKNGNVANAKRLALEASSKRKKSS